MNVQAALKTMLVVLGIGALTGFSQWKHTGGGAPPEVRAKLVYNDCMEKRKEAAFKEEMLPALGRAAIVQKQQFEADCRAEASGAGIQLGKEAPRPTGILEENGIHYAPNGQIQVQSKEECLRQIEDARKRAPGGLSPEWEKSQKTYCQSLYSDASN